MSKVLLVFLGLVYVSMWMFDKPAICISNNCSNQLHILCYNSRRNYHLTSTPPPPHSYLQLSLFHSALRGSLSALVAKAPPRWRLGPPNRRASTWHSAKRAAHRRFSSSPRLGKANGRLLGEGATMFPFYPFFFWRSCSFFVGLLAIWMLLGMCLTDPRWKNWVYEGGWPRVFSSLWVQKDLLLDDVGANAHVYALSLFYWLLLSYIWHPFLHDGLLEASNWVTLSFMKPPLKSEG